MAFLGPPRTINLKDFKYTQHSRDPSNAPSSAAEDLDLSSVDRGALQCLIVKATIKPKQACEAKPVKGG